MYMPAQIRLKTVEMVEIEPESDVRELKLACVLGLGAGPRHRQRVHGVVAVAGQVDPVAVQHELGHADDLPAELGGGLEERLLQIFVLDALLERGVVDAGLGRALGLALEALAGALGNAREAADEGGQIRRRGAGATRPAAGAAEDVRLMQSGWR